MSHRVRRIAATAAVVVAVGAACASADRPEGVVERWLTALNQGAAGRPDAFARASESERLLPGWRTRDAGTFDVIEVGRGELEGTRYLVPFRVVTVDGRELRGAAIVADGRVLGFATRPSAPLPSEGGPPIADADPWAWVAAVAVSLALIAATIGLMRLRPPVPRTSGRARG